MSENVNAPSAAQAAAKKKSPMLTELERIVYDRCNRTGDVPEAALAYDRVLHKLIVDFVVDEVRVDRIREKLENSVGFLKQQNAKLRAGVREPQDEPVCDADEREAAWRDAEAKAEAQAAEDSHVVRGVS